MVHRGYIFAFAVCLGLATTAGALLVGGFKQDSDGLSRPHGDSLTERDACAQPLGDSQHTSEDDDEPPVGSPAAGERVRMPAFEGMEYQLFLPGSWTAEGSQNYPVVVFLHGAGDGKFSVMNSQSLPRLLVRDQSTSFDSRQCWCLDAEYQDAAAYREAPSNSSQAFMDDVLNLRSPMADCGFAERFPAITVMPQGWLPDDFTRGWPDKIGQVEKLLRHVISTYRGDASRVVLSGQSMGGAGAWDFASKRPQLWSAVNVICAPMADQQVASAMHELPVWVVGWQGDGRAGNDQMVQYLKKHADNVDGIRYTRYVKAPSPPDPKYRSYLHHASYDLIYRDPRLWEWAFAQHRPSAADAWAGSP